MYVVRMMLVGLSAAAVAALSSLSAAAEDIFDIIAKTPEMSSFAAAVKTAGLDGPLKGKGPFTVLVPTDTAFGRLGAANLGELMADKRTIGDVVKIHIFLNDYPTARLTNARENSFRITTPEGTSLHVDVSRLKSKQTPFRSTPGPLVIEGLAISRPEITASNGTIYVIDKVFLPVKYRMYAAPAAPASAPPAPPARAASPPPAPPADTVRSPPASIEPAAPPPNAPATAAGEK